MAATVTVNSVQRVFDGAGRLRLVNISVSGTLDGTESLSAAACGVNAILFSPVTALVGNYSAANTSVLVQLGTGGALTFMDSNGVAGNGFLKNTTKALGGTVTGDILVVGN